MFTGYKQKQKQNKTDESNQKETQRFVKTYLNLV